jgi:hypothetical protein
VKENTENKTKKANIEQAGKHLLHHDKKGLNEHLAL